MKIRHSSSPLHALLSDSDGHPRPINCFDLKQLSERRATSAINYISAIKVPTSDLAWPAQPRSPDFRIGRGFSFNWHQLRKDYSRGGKCNSRIHGQGIGWLKSAKRARRKARKAAQKRHETSEQNAEARRGTQQAVNTLDLWGVLTEV